MQKRQKSTKKQLSTELSRYLLFIFRPGSDDFFCFCLCFCWYRVSVSFPINFCTTRPWTLQAWRWLTSASSLIEFYIRKKQFLCRNLPWSSLARNWLHLSKLRWVIQEHDSAKTRNSFSSINLRRSTLLFQYLVQIQRL